MSDPVHIRADRPAPDCVVLSVAGEVDLVTAPDLEQGITEHLAGTSCLIIDLTEISFFGSFGLATLIKADETARERGARLALVPNRLVRRTMELTSTTEYFALYDSVTAAREG